MLAKTAVLSVFLLSGGGAVVAARRARRLSDDDVRWGLTTLLALTGLWAVLEAGRVAVGFGEALAHAAYLGGLVVGLASVGAWLYFCSAYAGLEYHRDRGLLSLAGALYLAVIGVKITNPVHGAYYSAEMAAEPFTYLAVTNGTIHWLVVAGVYVLVGAGFVALWSTFRRAQADTTALWGLSMAALTPMVFVGAAKLWPGLVPALNYEPVGVAVFAVGALYAVEEEFIAVGGVARRQVVSDLESAVVVVDRDRQIVDCNEAASGLFPDAAPGQPVADAHWVLDEYLGTHGPDGDGGGPAAGADDREPATLDPDRGREEVTERLAYAGHGGESGDASDDEVVLTVEVDGTPRHFLCRAVDVGLAGRTLGWAVVLSDVTELEARRRELRRQNEQLDDFAEAITHELRNPLSVVQGYVDVLEDTPDDPETRERALGEIRAAADRMTVVVDELTTLAERGRTVTDVEGHRLSEVVRSVETPGPAIDVTADGVVTANGVRLREILSNLLEYADTEGAARMTVAVEQGHLVVGLAGDLDLEDTRRLLQYGYSGGTEDTRLALANVRALARAHGWTVSVESAADLDRADGVAFVFGGVETGPIADHDGDDHDRPDDDPGDRSEDESVLDRAGPGEPETATPDPSEAGPGEDGPLGAGKDTPDNSRAPGA